MKPVVAQGMTFTVFIVSQTDSAAYKAVMALDSQLSGIRNYAVLCSEENAGQPIDPVASFFPSIASSGRQALFAWLTTHSPNLELVRVAVIQSQKLSAEAQKSLLAAASWLQERCNTYAPNVAVRAIRVGLFGEGQVSEGRHLFVDGAALNLVVVPRDAKTHTGMAQPITLARESLLISHIQIELSILFGLWKEMQSCVVDSFPKVSGGDGKVWLRFVSSRALILECPPLPIASVVDDDGQLATPVDCDTFPRPADRIDAVIRAIYPAELRFQPGETPDGTVTTDARSFFREYISEFGRTMLRLPALLFKELQGDLADLSAGFLQEAVGGAGSSIRILLADSDKSVDVLELSDEQIESIISGVLAETDTPPRLALEARHWHQLVNKTLSFVDGSDIAAGDRAHIAQENWLVVEKKALCPAADDVDELLSAFSSSLRLNDHNEVTSQLAISRAGESATGKGGNDVTNLDDSSTSDVTENESSAKEWPQVDDVLAPPRHEDREVVSTQDEHSSEVTSTLRDSPIITNARTSPASLLENLAGEFMNEAEKAQKTARSMLDRLRHLPSEFAARDAVVISATIRIALFLGLGVAYLATGALSDRRSWLSGELLTNYTRDFIWTLFATIIVCMSFVGLLIKTSGRWQARTIIAISACVTILALEWVFFGPIRNFVLAVRPLRTTAVVGALVMAATVAIALVAYVRNRLSKNVIRKRFATMLLLVLSIFCLVGITAYLGNDRSPLRDLSDQTQFRLLIVGYVLAASLVIAAAGVYAFIVLRERYRLNLLVEILRWAEAELYESALAERTLRRAAVQWIGTAAVLARLVNYPLGRGTHDVDDSVQSKDLLDANLMKFDRGVLRLSARGQHGLASRLRTLFIRRGWLTSQYRQLVKAFQRDWAFSRGLSEEDSRRVEPELCQVAPEWSDVVSDSVRGSRWHFMRSVYEGKYDEGLLVQSGDVRLEDAYATILSDREAHSINDDKNLDCSSFFDRLVPAEARLLDGGLVTTVFSGNDPKQHMKTHIWWPSDLVAFDVGGAATREFITVQESEVLTPDRISSTIRLFGSCVSVSEFFTIDEISASSQVG